MKNLGVIFLKKLKSCEDERKKLKFTPVMDGTSIFDPNDRYVLSEPDTLIADICQ